MDVGDILGTGPLNRPLPLACRVKNWWWVPVVAPPLGAYLGGIVYLVFVSSTILRKPQILKNPVEYEDHKTPTLPKTMPPQTTTSALTHVSVSPHNRPSIQPGPS